MSIDLFNILKVIMLSRALFVAAELDIAEHLEKRNMPIAQLAQATNSDKNSLNRLMHFLHMHEVFNKQDDGSYSKTDLSSTMCADHPQSIKPFLLHDDATRWSAFGNLSYSIRTGRASFDHIYGKDYFAYLKQHPELGKRFDDAMTIVSAQEDPIIASKLAFKGTVADIGGGKGQLLNAIESMNPSIQGILFDLPQTIEHVSNLSSQCTAIGGSFFEPLIINADIFILKRILHDWDDERALNILQNVAAAMKPDSKLYIIDGLLDRAKNKQLLAAIDLALFVIFQGQERTTQQVETLLHKAGLKITNIVELTDLVCAVECQRK